MDGAFRCKKDFEPVQRVIGAATYPAYAEACGAIWPYSPTWLRSALVIGVRKATRRSRVLKMTDDACFASLFTAGASLHRDGAVGLALKKRETLIAA